MGVHTPEYRLETATANVQTALKRFDICYPVAQDNGDATWSAFHNQYGPAADWIDADGRIVYQRFGERRYANTEAAIRKLFPAMADASTAALIQKKAPPTAGPCLCRLRVLYG